MNLVRCWLAGLFCLFCVLGWVEIMVVLNYSLIVLSGAKLPGVLSNYSSVVVGGCGLQWHFGFAECLVFIVVIKRFLFRFLLTVVLFRCWVRVWFVALFASEFVVRILCLFTGYYVWLLCLLLIVLLLLVSLVLVLFYFYND